MSVDEKRRLIRELKTTMGYIRAADSLFDGLGKKKQRNKSAEKRERLQRRRDKEAAEEIEEQGK